MHQRDCVPPRLLGCLVVVALGVTSIDRARAQASDPDAVIETTAPVPVEEATPAQSHARLKLSLEGFHIGTTWDMPVTLTGLHLEAYPISRRWLRGGVGLAGGTGDAHLDGASASVVYGLVGISVGTQYPGRVTPFIEGHLAGGFMTATLDGPVTVSGLTVDNASGTTWLVMRGLDAGAEFYVFRRAYVSLSLGWTRSSWASPDVDPRTATAASTRNVQITTVTADSLLWKVGLGI